MMINKDQLNRNLSFPDVPKRIISLVPSQTELLVDLGLFDSLVGVTKFCEFPTYIKKEKAIVGGTKNYRFDVIDSLRPDLIIGNKEENDQAGIEKLMSKYPVWMSDIYTLSDSYDMIERLGDLLDVSQRAKIITERLRMDFDQKPEAKGNAVYLIWNDPIMAAGKKTFIDEMLPWAGFQNAITINRYPELTMEELKKFNPDYLLLSSEPFPFKSKHIQAFQDQLPETKVKLVDGAYFSWYGTRLLGARDYFASI